MASSIRAIGRQYWVATRAMIVLTVVLGVAYPLVVTGIGQLTMNAKANGSLVSYNGTTVGSSLIGQSYVDQQKKSLTQWFQSRPSAAGDGYNAMSSSGSNLGPNNPGLVIAIQRRKRMIEKTYGVLAKQIPADAVTASGSGLDPNISPAYAALQVDTVAAARGISKAEVEKLVARNTRGRELGYLGEPVVNVVQLNLDLARLDPAGNNG